MPGWVIGLRLLVSAAQLGDGELQGRFVGRPGDAIGIVLAGAADFDMTAYNVGNSVRIDEALKAGKPNVPRS